MALRLKLDMDTIAEDFFSGTYLLGLMTLVKDYKISLALNKSLHFDLRLKPEMEIKLHRRNRMYYFEVHEYQDFYNRIQYYLYHNQHQGEYLLPEYRHLDYLLLIRGEGPLQHGTTPLEQVLRQLPEVQLVVSLTEENIASRSNLVF